VTVRVWMGRGRDRDLETQPAPGRPELSA
jgi:hypothetical protein